MHYDDQCLIVQYTTLDDKSSEVHYFTSHFWLGTYMINAPTQIKQKQEKLWIIIKFKKNGKNTQANEKE